MPRRDSQVLVSHISTLFVPHGEYADGKIEYHRRKELDKRMNLKKGLAQVRIYRYKIGEPYTWYRRESRGYSSVCGGDMWNYVQLNNRRGDLRGGCDVI